MRGICLAFALIAAASSYARAVGGDKPHEKMPHHGQNTRKADLGRAGREVPVAQILRSLAVQARKNGEAKILNKVTSEKLGYGGEVSARILRDVLQADASGYSTSVFLVVKSERGDVRGDELLIGNSKTEDKDGGTYADIVFYRCTLSGELLVVSRGSGMRGDIKHEFWDVKKPAIKRKFKDIVARLAERAPKKP